VDWRIVAVNFLYAALGVLLMWVSYKVIDHLMPQVDFAEELKRGNIAMAIFIAAMFLSIAMIIAGALN
jgi:putative membrane protein